MCNRLLPDMKRIALLSTLCALISCSPKTFTVVQIADAQLGFDAAIKGQVPGAEYVNDLTYEATLLAQAVEYVNELNPDVVIFTGDQINLPENTEQWDTFDSIISDINGEIVVRHLPGNHDVYHVKDGIDLTPFACRYGEDRFVYHHDNVCLIGLNSNYIKYNDPREEEQYEWLQKTLSQLEKDTITLIFCHHSFFLTDIEEGDSYFPIQKDKRKRYFDLFAQYGVRGVYAGHLHNNSDGEYNGIAMKTSTSSAYQLGEAQPSVRVIEIQDGVVLKDGMHAFSQKK